MLPVSTSLYAEASWRALNLQGYLSFRMTRTKLITAFRIMYSHFHVLLIAAPQVVTTCLFSTRWEVCFHHFLTPLCISVWGAGTFFVLKLSGQNPLTAVTSCSMRLTQSRWVSEPRWCSQVALGAANLQRRWRSSRAVRR